MLERYEKEIENLLDWYDRAKRAAIDAESIDTKNRTYIQPLHEQRYCLDHFMRAIAYEINGDSEEKVKKAISSAIGHLQRGYSDSVEWMLVSVREEFYTILDPYTSEQIKVGFPEYYETIRLGLDDITAQVNKWKISKSVENAEENEPIVRFIDADVLFKLNEYLTLLHKRESTLIEIRERDCKTERKATIKDKIVLPIITGIVGAVIASLIVLAF